MNSKIVSSTSDIKKTVNDDLIIQLSEDEGWDTLKKLIPSSTPVQLNYQFSPSNEEIKSSKTTFNQIYLYQNIGSTVLFWASVFNKYQIVKALIDAKVDSNLTGKTQFTPLMAAAKSGSDKSLELLINAGADVDVRDSSGNSALMLANIKGSDECVDLLINAINLKSQILPNSEPVITPLENSTSDNPRSVRKLPKTEEDYVPKLMGSPKINVDTPNNSQKSQPSSSTRKSKSYFNIITNIKKKIINKHLKKNIKNISIDILKDFLTKEQLALCKKSITCALTQTEREKIKEWLFGNEIDNHEEIPSTTQLRDRSEGLRVHSEDSIVRIQESIGRLQKIGSLLDICFLTMLFICCVLLVFFMYQLCSL